MNHTDRSFYDGTATYCKYPQLSFPSNLPSSNSHKLGRMNSLGASYFHRDKCTPVHPSQRGCTKVIVARSCDRHSQETFNAHSLPCGSFKPFVPSTSLPFPIHFKFSKSKISLCQKRISMNSGGNMACRDYPKALVDRSCSGHRYSDYLMLPYLCDLDRVLYASIRTTSVIQVQVFLTDCVRHSILPSHGLCLTQIQFLTIEAWVYSSAITAVEKNRRHASHSIQRSSGQRMTEKLKRLRK
ncbi:hypothetical protein FB446DRAFT_138084 [Lentinula raphanica]|nr:hypothetical protein FB446DRAFT_138084 [Lentinula raphanica]